MPDIIKVGDNVSACWETARGRIIAEGRIIRLPCEGDELWYIAVDDKIVHAINPRASSFERFILWRKLDGND